MKNDLSKRHAARQAVARLHLRHEELQVLALRILPNLGINNDDIYLGVLVERCRVCYGRKMLSKA